MPPQRQDSTTDQLETVALVADKRGLPQLATWVREGYAGKTELSRELFWIALSIADGEGCRDAADAISNLWNRP